ncbi:MAG: serine/threonine-protein kinase, partial [Myxococcota bacterium]
DGDSSSDGSGRYRSLREFARGGIGRVLEAHDARLGRTVAIKEPIDPEQGTALFLREALITARLEHPGIVPVHDAGRWSSGSPYYVMKRVSGTSLAKLIRQRSTVRDRLGLLPSVISVVETIAYAHSKGVIHRDLKPDNVLLGEFGETVVVDWGLAHDKNHTVAALGEMVETIHSARQSSGLDGPSGLTYRTLAGQVIGTPAYMSPEQARGEPVDEQTDVYALGALLYEVLTGRPPYAGMHGRVIDRVVCQAPEPVRDRLGPGRDLPDDLLAIVDKAMARERGERYASAKELAADLRCFQTGQVVSAFEYSAWALLRRWLWRHRGMVLLAVVATALLAALTVVGVTRIIHERDAAWRSHERLVFLQA